MGTDINGNGVQIGFLFQIFNLQLGSINFFSIISVLNFKNVIKRVNLWLHYKALLESYSTCPKCTCVNEVY